MRKIKIAERLKNAITAFRNSSETVTATDLELLQWLGIDNMSKNVQEITYYTCLKMLSESLGKMPLKHYQDTENGRIRAKPDRNLYVLSKRPNKFMTATTFWTAVEMNRCQYGNGIVLMRQRPIKERGYIVGSELRDLWILPSNNTRILVDNLGIFQNKGDVYYEYSDPYDGKQYIYKSEDVLHFKTHYTYDGIKGKSVQEILAGSIEGALESQKFMNNLYKSGMTASMAMQYVGDLDEKLLNQLKDKYSKLLCGSQNAGKVVPVPLGLQLQPLNVKPVDAQFFELKKFSALQIASAFGIKPNQINNYEKSSYANSETQQLAFLVDTMLWIIKQYEDEIDYKVLGPKKMEEGHLYKFNEKVILRMDSKTQAEVHHAYVNDGVYSVNDVRDNLDMDHVEGGDIHMVNGNFIPLTSVPQNRTKGSENNA